MKLHEHADAGYHMNYLLGRNWVIILSISASWGPVALSRSCSRVFMSLAFSASSPALLTNPHLTHISIRSSGLRLVHLGTNEAASRVLPAPSTSL